ncbi:DUF4174 domain-containing protein [Salegentibacter sp.]|uniref:DUF4174 domain-containing protein n=1 Tax=Salegentibacter sp. TaxID=1903072 RepID=UPI00356531F4
MAVNAQDIKDFQWKNRLVLIIAEDKENQSFQKQLAELQKDQDGLKERKLIIYKILPGKFSKGLESETWENDSVLYQKYKTNASGFQVLLLGLDGGIKLDQSEIISLKKLFNTIDSMPMRQAEMRKTR